MKGESISSGEPSAGGASPMSGESVSSGEPSAGSASPMSGESVSSGDPSVDGASAGSGEPVNSGEPFASGASPMSGETARFDDLSASEETSAGGGSADLGYTSVGESSSAGGENPGSTGVSPLSGETSGRADESSRGGDSPALTSESPLSGDAADLASVSPLNGDASEPGEVSPVNGGATSSGVSPSNGETLEPTRVSPLSGETSGVADESLRDGDAAALTSESPLDGDELQPSGREGSAGQGFLARNRRVVVALAAAVVVVAALVVAVQVLPGGGAGDANSGNVAATSSLVPGTSKTAAPASVVPTQPGVPRAGEFGAWASRTSQWLDIPLRAMNGYAQATVTLGKEQPGCHLSWITLAAIGKIASDHGRAQGNRVGENGTLAKPLGTVEVFDFYHRPVSTPGAAGPLQLSPAVWSKWQRSASGGKPDIQNIDDSALTAGRALCANGRDLATDWWNGVATLEPAPVVLHRTLATTNVYGTVGQSDQPPNPAVLTAVDFAIDQIGLPYVWGGNGTRDADPGFDCSGLTTAAYASADIKLMRTADTQFRSVAHVSEPQLGDLIFYGEPASTIHHVGIYIGNQQMIDAPQTGQAVQVHPYRKPGDDYAGAGRPTA
ncbi:NlpC/P60 family protein [Amycolatopsis echigonensis]